jgi:formate hydrogenlyase subunit 4
MILTSARIKALTQLSLDIGNIFFATVFLGPLFIKTNYSAVLTGLVLAVGFWYLGIRFTKY